MVFYESAPSHALLRTDATEGQTQRKVSTFNSGHQGTMEPQWPGKQREPEALFSMLAARKHRMGYTLLWAITASNKVVIFENAVPFLIMIIITITASRKIIAWVMLMLFIT